MGYISVRDFLMIGIGKPLFPLRYLINLYKGGTVFYVLFLIFYFGSCSGLYLYLFLHGSYGLFWIYKDIKFGDKSFQQ